MMKLSEKSLREYVFGVEGEAGIAILELEGMAAFKLSGRKASREEFVTVIDSYLNNEEFCFDNFEGHTFDLWERQEEAFNDAVGDLLSELDDAELVDSMYASYSERYDELAAMVEEQEDAKMEEEVAQFLKMAESASA